MKPRLLRTALAGDLKGLATLNLKPKILSLLPFSSQVKNYEVFRSSSNSQKLRRTVKSVVPMAQATATRSPFTDYM